MTRYPRLTVILLAAPLLAGVVLPVGDVGRDLAPVVRAEVDGRYLVTAYAPGCGDSGLTALGTVPHRGTISAPPSLPFGTRLFVENYGVGVVEDRGGAIGPGRLDVWLPTCWEARQWGRRSAWVSVVPPSGSSNAAATEAPNEEPAQESEDGND